MELENARTLLSQQLNNKDEFYHDDRQENKGTNGQQNLDIN